MKRKFWNWINQKTEGEIVERDLEINGTIAEDSWFDDEVTPEMFKQELFSCKGPINLWLNSPGGDCIAASRIYSMLMDYPGEVTVKIDGIAASAASVIAMAGTKVLMSPTALMMIHNPATSAFGDYRDMNKVIELLNEVKESIINAYELKTGLSRTVISHMMDAETWTSVVSSSVTTHMVMVFALLSTVSSPSVVSEVLEPQLAKTQVSNINMLRVKHTSFLFILVPPCAQSRLKAWYGYAF